MKNSRSPNWQLKTINDEDVIYLDAGSTTLEMIPFLQGKQITVVTNSVQTCGKFSRFGACYDHFRWNDQAVNQCCFRI